MNYRVVLKTLGRVMLIIALFMCLPLAVGEYYGEKTYLSFLIPIAGLIAVGLPLGMMKVKDKAIYAREGFIIVALVWIIVSLVGALPFVISGSIPNYIDAVFETVSGFTTTGASVLTLDYNVISLPKGIMFWRIFTHFLGGMGVLVFILAIIPSDGNAMHIFRAESPGPSASKLVSKISFTARILYTIYTIMTLLETTFLLFSGMGLYEALLTAFSTAGTGGFGIYGDSIQHYNSVYIEMVVAVFMLLFSINFNLFYLFLVRKSFKAFKSEELFAFLIIVGVSTIAIALNILSTVGNFWQALRYSFFQTATIVSTTGFASIDFAKYWPAFSLGIIMFLSMIGACGGSTGGGIKVSRFMILAKSGSKELKKSLHPRSFNRIKFEGQSLSEDVERNVKTYFIFWIAIVILSTLLLSLDFSNGGDLFTNFSATIACIGNVGPGVTEAVGPFGGYAGYNAFSKIILSFDMLAGRLEIFPLILLFTPRTWKA